MTTPSDDSEAVAAFTADWEIDQRAHIAPVNQFIVQDGLPVLDRLNDGMIYLTLGHVTPPALIGTPDQQRAQASRMGTTVPVVPVACVVMTLDRAEELAGLLLTQVSKTRQRTGSRADAEAQARLQLGLSESQG